MCVSHYSFFFYPKVHYQTINFFFFAVYQLAIARMDKASLLQHFERNSKLRFKFMGSYPSDTVPELTKNSFAKNNSAPGNVRGKQWIMIARLDKSYYFADSLGKKRSTYHFLTKKYRRMVPRKLQKTDNLCGFYAICSAFLLFKFFQKILNNDLEVHVLIFIGNFM